MSSRVVSNTTGWNLPPSVCPLLTAGRPCISEPSMYERVPGEHTMLCYAQGLPLDEEELFDMHNFNWMKDADPEGYFTQKAKDHITYMDVNGDGKVDWSEFKYFMKPHVVSGLQV